LCAITTGDLQLAESVLETGLTYPNILYHVERPRVLSGAALLARERGDLESALKQAIAAVAYSQEHAMHNHQPFNYLVLGKVHLAAGQYEQSFNYSAQAEETAAALGLRPIVWQACQLAAQALNAGGSTDLAQVKLDQARQVIAEIAAQIQDEDLKQAFLTGAIQKLGLQFS
jgi:ATP/maltotriose-dependent transcriptional regulator MalT